MGDRINLPIPLGFYQHDSLKLSAQRCINWIPVIPESEALNNRALILRSGLTQFADTKLGKCRGSHTLSGVPFFVNGTSLVSISSSGKVTVRGIITGAGMVSMADNGSSLVIVVPGGDSFVWDGVSLTQIVDPDFQTSDTVSFYRGFFVFTTTDGKQLFVSNLNTPLVFDALDFGSAEGDPDRIVTQVLDHDELSIIGQDTTENFKLIQRSTLGFPLQIIPGAFTEKGASSKFGVVKFDNTYLFIGGGENEKPAIWRQASSSQAVKISTDAIDNEIQKFSEEEISNAFSMTYSEKGQFLAIFTFVSITRPSKTFFYNATTSALSGRSVWSEMQTGVSDNSWRVNTIVKAYGKFLCGDSIDGRIGELDSNNFTDYDESIFCQAATSPFSQNGTDIFAGEFCATFEAGVGLTVGDGSDPVVRMDYSDDGAKTFSFETERKLGKIGEYGHDALWRRQGRFPDQRVVRITATDDVKRNLVRLSATPEVGTQ